MPIQCGFGRLAADWIDRRLRRGVRWVRRIMASCIHTKVDGAAPLDGLGTAPGAPRRLAARTRLRGLLVATACWAVAAAAWSLSPRPSGHGTHEQLGLPACSFLARTGLPCPSCGLTTSLAEMARGRAGRAFHAHPFGPLLLAAVILLGAAGSAQVACGRDVLRLLRPSLWWLAAAVVAMFAGWGLKLAIGFAAGELPVH